MERTAISADPGGLVRKVVRELNEFDNVYFEICNEPYFGGVTGLAGTDPRVDRRAEKDLCRAST